MKKILMTLLVLWAPITTNASQTIEIDTQFTRNMGTAFNDTVLDISLQNDGNIVAAGYFTAYNGHTQNHITQLNPDGSIDLEFASTTGAGFDLGVSSIAIQPNSQIIVGGYFTSYNGRTQNHITRINTNGSIDDMFASTTGAGFDGSVQKLLVQTDGKIVVLGNFTNYNGVPVANIARLNSDGTIDAVFASSTGSGFDSGPTNMIIEPDGQIVVVGYFTSCNGRPQNYITRLNSDGTIDESFATNIGTGFDVEPSSIVLEPNGKVVLNGYFSTFDGIQRDLIVRLNENGTLDQSFEGHTNDLVEPLHPAIYAGDGVLALGGFNASNNVLKIGGNGQIETNFAISSGVGIDSPAIDMVRQSDGKLVVVGMFSKYNQTIQNRIMRLKIVENSNSINKTVIKKDKIKKIIKKILNRNNEHRPGKHR